MPHMSLVVNDMRRILSRCEYGFSVLILALVWWKMRQATWRLIILTHNFADILYMALTTGEKMLSLNQRA